MYSKTDKSVVSYQVSSLNLKAMIYNVYSAVQCCLFFEKVIVSKQTKG